MSKNKNVLPVGWDWIKHDQISEINPKTSAQEVKNDMEVSFIPMRAVDEVSGKFDLSATRTMSKVIKGYTSFIDGDIIFAKITPCMENGKIALLKDLKNGIGFGSTEFHVSRLTKYTDKKFIFFYFVQASFRGEARRNMTGSAGQLRVPSGYFKNVKIPVPPLPEQHAIVSKIEQIFSELDKGIESLKTAQQQLKVYRQSVLKWAFEGKLTEKWRQNQALSDAQELLEQIQKEREEKAKASGKKLKQVAPLTKEELAALPELPEGWGWVNIEIIVDMDKYSLKAGPFGSSLKKEFYVEKGYKIYGQEQVIAGNSLNGDYYISKEKFEELISNKIQPHDILISLVGTVGKVLILPEHCEPGIINPRLIKVTLNRNYYNPLFFKYYFESSFLKSLYSSKAQGTTMDVLNLGIIKALPFPICSIPEQHQIVQEIESRLSECDNMEATIATSLQQAEALRQSILKKAFEGRLLNERDLEAVRQDPTWEPAEKLLERIRAEKAVLHSGKKGQKSKA